MPERRFLGEGTRKANRLPCQPIRVDAYPTKKRGLWEGGTALTRRDTETLSPGDGVIVVLLSSVFGATPKRQQLQRRARLMVSGCVLTRLRLPRRAMKTWWMSNDKMTVKVVSDNSGVITDAAPVVRKFVGQPLRSLSVWMNRLPGFVMQRISP